jgi:GNAT superfamily N-acetyltransferase
VPPSSPSLPDGFELSTDPGRLDRAWVHRYLSEDSYWARGRARTTQDRAIDGSTSFGIYRAGSGAQVGYARLVTDGATFGWLCDVFVDASTRGAGLGKALVAAVTAHADDLGLGKVMLGTGDAHDLYASFGWQPLAEPATWMSRPLRGAPTT